MWWMPRDKKPMKDVPGCEKPRGGAKSRYYSGISEWGNPALRKQGDHPPAGGWGEPGELKHLSSRRKRNNSLSSGERKGKSPNPDFIGRLQDPLKHLGTGSGKAWKSLPERVKAPYTKP